MTEKHNNFTRIDFASIAEMLNWRKALTANDRYMLFSVVHGVTFEAEVEAWSSEKFAIRIRFNSMCLHLVAKDDIEHLFALVPNKERDYSSGLTINGQHRYYYDKVNNRFVYLDAE